MVQAQEHFKFNFGKFIMVVIIYSVKFTENYQKQYCNYK